MNTEQITSLISNKQLALFCGAGISMAAPAGLPDWKTLRDSTLRALANQSPFLNNHADILTDIALDEERIGISPEYLASLVSSITKGYFLSFQSLKDGSPNINHRHIASMVNKGYMKFIITTNFDIFIEKAFKDINSDKKLIVVRTDVDFANLSKRFDDNDFLESEVFLIKLHGCLEIPETIIATVEQEAKGLSNSKKSVLSKIFCQYWIGFWGYSGADLKLDEDYLLMHTLKDSIPGWIWSFYQNEKGVKEVPSALVQKFSILYGSKSHVTHNFFPKVFESFSSDLITSTSTSRSQSQITRVRNEEIKNHLFSWAKECVGSQASYWVFAFLFQHIGMLDKAVECFEKNLESSTNEIDKCASLNNIAMICMQQENYQRAEENYQRAFRNFQQNIVREEAFLTHPIASLTGIATINYYKGNYQEAKNYYNKALVLCKNKTSLEVIKKTNTIYNTLSCIALKEGKFNEAQCFIDKAMEVCSNSGDLKTQVHVMCSQGLIYMYTNEWTKACDHYEDTLKLAKSVGDISVNINILSNLKTSHMMCGNLDKVKEIEQTIAIKYKNLESSSPNAKEARYMSSLLEEDKNYKIDELMLQLEDYCKTNNIMGEVIISRMLASEYLQVEDYKNAEKFCRNSVEKSGEIVEERISSMLILSTILLSDEQYNECFLLLDETIDLCLKYNYESFLEQAILSLFMLYPYKKDSTLYKKKLINCLRLELSNKTKLNVINKIFSIVRSFSTENLHHDQEEILKILYELSESVGYKEYTINASICLSDYYHERGLTSQALKYMEKVAELSDYIEDKERLATTLSRLGLMYKMKGSLDKGLSFYKEAEKVLEMVDLQNPILLANMGRAYQQKGNLAFAKKYITKAELTVNGAFEDQVLAVTCNTIGAFYSNSNSYAKALTFTEKALLHHEKTDNISEIAKTHGNLGTIYFCLKKKSKAVEYYSKSIELYRKIGAYDLVQQLEMQLERVQPTTFVSSTNKIGRNDPCKCGSGKKYKKCCGKN